jgi:hypothetical protein
VGQKAGIRFFIGVTLVFLFGALSLSAQETTGSYFVRQNEAGEQFIVQRLLWPGDENASRYEVVVEREGNRGFAEIHRESTTGDYVDLSLGPGKYRYQVRIFNLLNQFEYVTNWASFTIIPAYQPGITSYTPSALQIPEDYRWEPDFRLELHLSGRDFVDGGEAYLVSMEPLENPSAQAPLIIPRDYLPSGNTAVLVFTSSDLRPGVYSILVRNPGGLEAFAGPLRIDLFGPTELEFSVGYMPLLPLYGYLLDTFDRFIPLGLDIRVSCIFVKRLWGSLGLELHPNLSYLSDSVGKADVSAFIAGGELNLVYRNLLPLRGFVFNGRLGAGLAAAPGMLVFDYGNYKSDPITSWVPLGSLGFSLAWRFTTFFYIELGTDYVHFFTSDPPHPGYLRPFVNLGRRFFLN